MENIKITKEKFIKIKEGVLFILLLLWLVMPVLKSFYPVRRMFNYSDDYYFILMRIIGVVGIGLAIFSIFSKIKNSENKKETLKELSPIFIFVLYMIWTLISCILSPNRKLAFFGSSYRKEGYLMYMIYAGFFFCAFLLESKKFKKILLNIFIVVTIFLIIVSRIPTFCI